MTNLNYNHLIYCLTFLFVLSCASSEEFEKDCDSCDQIQQKTIKTTLINFVYNDISAHISADGERQLNEVKETLRNGHKFMACGCMGNTVVYHLWCANDETFQLEVSVSSPDDFQIIGISEAEFSHP